MKTHKRTLISSIIFLLIFINYANAAKPKVIKTTPAHGQQNISPALAQITIEFDQDMDTTGGYSICGGGPNFPETTGKPQWTNKRTLVMSVKLQANHNYEMSINCPSYQNCKGANGESAEIYPLNFKTGSGSASQNASASLQQSAVLLQQGIYAEETEGNLDKAMEIYTKIRADYNDVERIAARATYQMGMCYLKKGEKENAAEKFEEVISYFSQQKTVVEKAQQQLDKLGISSKPKLIQEMYNDIEPNGLIHFKSPQNHTNFGTIPISSTSFINSDFVNVTGMYYKNGQPITYSTTHEGNIYRYNIKFDKPIQPGETVEGIMEGTITGLIKPVSGKADTFGYFMNHSPASGMPTLRKETYLLPKGAEVISTSEGMQQTTKDDRIELRVEKIIPPGGSIITEFQYKLGGTATLTPKQLQLETENLTQQGWNLWKQRKLTEAEEAFKKAIELNPNSENAYQGLGWAQLNQGKTLNATDSFEKCIAINPNNSAALNGLGWIADGAGEKDKAIEWWQKAVETSNGAATASLSGLTKAYMEKGEYQNAISNYEMWLKAEPANQQVKTDLQQAKDKATADYKARLNIVITLEAAKSPDGDKLTVQYAIIEICNAINVPYQFKKSLALAGSKARRYIEPVKFENITANKAIDSVLKPLGLNYAIDAYGLYLSERK
jgi:tetratricopeptide (TPR) repeat protein